MDGGRLEARLSVRQATRVAGKMTLGVDTCFLMKRSVYFT